MKLLTSIQHQQQVIVQQFDKAPSTLFKSYIPILKLHLLNISSQVMESPTHSSGIGSFEQFVYKTCQKLFDVMKYTPTCSMCFHIECYYQLNHRLLRIQYVRKRGFPVKRYSWIQIIHSLNIDSVKRSDSYGRFVQE